MGLQRSTLVFLILGWCFTAIDVCADTPQPPAAKEPQPTADPAEVPVEDSKADAPITESSSQEDEPVTQNPVIVYLDRSAPDDDGVRNLARSGLLSAELVRQAFLMAAREEMGLTTRDARLGDPRPTNGENTPFVINADKKEPKRQSLWRGLENKRVLVGEYVVDSPFNKLGYPLTSKRMEKMSRGAFVDFLRKAGFDGKPIPKSDTSVPEAIETLLSEMTFTSQFSAIRQLHSLTRKEGTSNAALEALVRGYANLGCLTEYYWHPAHKVFKARAMLYADRLFASQPKNPRAFWHRAYARTLVGLHRYARSDLDEANAAWEALPEADRPQRPGWVKLLDAHCQYAPDEIDVASFDKSDRQLASLIRHLTVERCGYLPVMEKSALDTVKEIPECYRVYDDLSRFGGIGIQHSTTLAGLSMFGATAYPRLLAMPNLPPSAKKIARSKQSNWLTNMLPGLRHTPGAESDEFQRRSTLIESLFDTDLPEDDANTAQGKPQGPTDLGEPSWTTLGLLIRELSFMQVQRRAWFQARVWCVSPDEFIEASAPLVKQHPYRAYITRYAWDKTLRDQALQELLNLELVDPELTAAGIRKAVKREDAQKAARMWKQMSSHFDYTAFDFVRFGLTREIPSSYCGERLLTVDSMSPYARMLSVHANWDKVKDRATEWEKTGAKSPGLMLAFGDRYLKTQQFEDAARCYKAAIEICPSLNACRGLAAVYHKQEKMDLWLETLEDFLKQPDYGLGHARVRTQIAREFMSQGDYARALPYAEDGAKSYAGSCPTCAAWCHEGLKNWSDAETYFRNCSERYRGSVFEWYFFCRRTGKGDLDAARQCVESALADPSTRAGLRDDMVAFFHVLEGRHEQALEGFQTRFQKRSLAYNGLWVALLADQLDQPDLRDKTLKQVVANGKKEADSEKETPIGLPALAELLAVDLEAGGKGDLDPIALEKLCPQGNTWVTADVFYFASRYLEQHEQTELAADCRKHSLTEWIPERWSYILAESEMLARGHTPDEFGPTLKDTEAEDSPANENDEETIAPESETSTGDVAA